MKRLLFTLTLAFSLFSLSSFANDDVNPAAIESFKTSFKNATEVNWSSSAELYKASFQLNGQYISAYYNSEGKLLAMTRNISPLQLPLAMQTSLKTNYANYWISDLFEYSDETGTTYYLTVEDGDSRIILKSGQNSNWETYKKARKS